MKSSSSTERTPSQEPKAIPYVKGLPLLGSLLEMRKDPLQFLSEVAMEHGPIARVKLGPINYILLTSPEYIKHILYQKTELYEKSVFYQKLWPVVGRGLLTSEGKKWRKNRRTIQPGFTKESMSSICDTIKEVTETMLTQWSDKAANGVSVELTTEMATVTEAILFRALFSESKNIDGGKSHEKDWALLNEEIGKRFFAFTTLHEKLPFPRTRQFNSALKQRLGLADTLIQERRTRSNPGEDILGMLLAAKDTETGEGMTDREVRDELMTLFFAGHETTGLALVWFWYLVPQYPDVCEKIRAEAKAVLTDSEEPIIDKVMKLTYTRMVVQEVMRFYPPAPWFSRTPTDHDTIDGYKIPAGSVCGILPWVMHRHPDYWENPDQFDPERFRPERTEKRNKLVYMPFGAGPRQCIGNHFAMLEASLIVAMTIAKFNVEVTNKDEVKPVALITLRPSTRVAANLSSA